MSRVKKPKQAINGSSGQDAGTTAPALIPWSAKTAREEAPKKPILIRFDSQLLERIDTAVKRRGISRSAWIQFTLSRALDQGEG